MIRANFDAVLFTSEGKPTPLLLAFWRDRAPVVSLQAAGALLASDRTASDLFRSQWRAAFPNREPMPVDAIAERDGRGAVAFWDVFA